MNGMTQTTRLLRYILLTSSTQMENGKLKNWRTKTAIPIATDTHIDTRTP